MVGGFRKRSRRSIRCTGSRPSRPVRQRKSKEVNCVRCNVTLDMWAYEEDLFPNIIECPSCQIVFNHYTGEILIDRTKQNKEE